MEALKQALRELPHVQQVWLTDDNKWHLHPHNGGKMLTRGEVLQEAPKPEATPATSPIAKTTPKGNKRK